MTSAANSNHLPSAPPLPDFFEREGFSIVEASAPELTPEEAAEQRLAAARELIRISNIKTSAPELTQEEEATPLANRDVSLTPPAQAAAEVEKTEKTWATMSGRERLKLVLACVGFCVMIACYFPLLLIVGPIVALVRAIRKNDSGLE